MDWTGFGAMPAAVLGAVVGSFLNVVIYRLPRGLSIASPRWSFCPSCGQTIGSRDNVPIFGWLNLQGRCRSCRSPISMMYPAVEAATALVFVMIWDAFFVARTVPAATDGRHVWPMLITYWFLFSALLASAGMDIESYTIHIQVLLSALFVGVVGHALAGPGSVPVNDERRLPPAICLIAVVAGATWLATHLLSWFFGNRSKSPTVEEPTPSAHSDAGNLRQEPGAPPDVAPLSSVISAPKFHPIPILLFAIVVVGLASWQSLAPASGLHMNIIPAGQRAIVATAVLLLMLILASLETRHADQQIVEDLERERSQARGMILREFFTFIPAIGVGLAIWFVMRRNGSILISWPEALQRFGTTIPWSEHVAAGALALAAAILAAGLGWAVRILGTLTFGKEAFGTGDIYILAAIGAVCGFWLVCIGFLLAAMLALVGVLATSFRKTSRAIPFGPWLALGAFVGLWVERGLVEFFRPLGSLAWSLISGQRFY